MLPSSHGLQASSNANSIKSFSDEKSGTVLGFFTGKDRL
ncbi:hypothetical protein NBRC111894_2798 [Sporolactobacillus inulinus]|uniref:Uncharacterized protein n=1 Tax=Sporolactobacillus inulinus TaxID=2078 RepID=A0A4Y1ZE60_9BACL|nr:hypothetical protein NBRC111894_2798 [Sporolactobacillus inulinus]